MHINKILYNNLFCGQKELGCGRKHESIIAFLKNDIGDVDISDHLKDCSSCGTYTSVALVD